jgi:beta-glucanase (GH16 family)
MNGSRASLWLVIAAALACSARAPLGEPSTGVGGAGSGGSSAGSSAGGAGTGGLGGVAGTAGQTSPPLTGGAAGSGGGGLGGSAGSGGSGGKTVSGSSAHGHPDASKQYPAYDGFTLYLVEEFDEPLDLNGDAFWTWSDGQIPASRVAFVEEQIDFTDGKLVLTATDEVSGELRSRFNAFRWGRYEASIRAPATAASFIHSMFVFRTPGNILWREIDVEILGDHPNTVNTNLIMAENTGDWSSSIQETTLDYPFGGSPAQSLPPGFGNRDAFHVYAFEALPDSITWYVDGLPIRRKQAGVGDNELDVPQESMKIMMNLWVFVSAGLGGDPSQNQYPFSAEYEWFRFYRWDQDDRYPCEPLPECLDPDDLVNSRNNDKEP